MPLKLGPFTSQPDDSQGSVSTPSTCRASEVVEASASFLARSRYASSPVARANATNPPRSTPWLYVQVVSRLLRQVEAFNPSLTSRSSLIIPDASNHSHTAT